MKRLILMRHAKATAAGSVADRERPLTPRGLRDAAQAGEAIQRGGWRPARALVSDARRTRQTFEAVAPALEPAPELQLEPALYNASVETILRVIGATPGDVECLLAIGHNPGFGEAALRLATTGPAEGLDRLGQGFPTATFAVIALPGGWVAPEAGGRLEALVLAG